MPDTCSTFSVEPGFFSCLPITFLFRIVHILNACVYLCLSGDKQQVSSISHNTQELCKTPATFGQSILWAHWGPSETPCFPFAVKIFVTAFHTMRRICCNLDRVYFVISQSLYIYFQKRCCLLVFIWAGHYYLLPTSAVFFLWCTTSAIFGSFGSTWYSITNVLNDVGM